MTPDRIAQWVLILAALTLSVVTLAQNRRLRQRMQPALYVSCLVERCTNTTRLSAPAPGWTPDDLNRLSCPEHPPATSCRICGQPRGDDPMLCADCATPRVH